MFIYGGVNTISTFQKDRFCVNEIRCNLTKNYKNILDKYIINSFYFN